MRRVSNSGTGLLHVPDKKYANICPVKGILKMNTKLKKTTLLSALGICIFSGILYIHSSTSQNNTEKKSSLIKTKGTDQETRKEYYTSTENNIMEDQPRGIFEEEELSEIITNDGIYEEDTSIVN